MSTNKLKRIGLGMVAAAVTALTLSACADDYSRGYGRTSVGVTYSSPGYYRDGYRYDHGYRYNRDRDGDGVPNRFDRYPSDPYRD